MAEPSRSALRFALDAAGRTHVAGHHVQAPLAFTRAFHLDGPSGPCTALLQSTSGALTAGDDITVVLEAGTGARVELTTRSATAVHAGGPVAQHLRLLAAEGSRTEVVPEPYVLFAGSDLTTSVRVDLAPGAVVLVWDAFVAHDPRRSGRAFGRLRTELCVAREGEVVAADRLDLAGDDEVTSGAGALGGRAHHAGLWLLGDGTALLADALRSVALPAAVVTGVSVLPADAGVGVRLLSSDAAALRAGLHALRAALHAAWATGACDGASVSRPPVAAG